MLPRLGSQKSCLSQSSPELDFGRVCSSWVEVNGGDKANSDQRRREGSLEKNGNEGARRSEAEVGGEEAGEEEKSEGGVEGGVKGGEEQPRRGNAAGGKD